MSRTDLLSLSEDDLTAMVNRGSVKRALRELDDASVMVTWTDDADGLTAVWSDGATCRIPVGSSLAQAMCDCASTTTCRHLVRTVLAYQRWCAAEPVASLEAKAVDAGAESEAEAAAGTESSGEPGADAAPTAADLLAPWNPGDIPEPALESALGKAALGRARKLLNTGMLVDVFLGAKPRVWLVDLPHTVTFMVPGDIRYTRCDCDDAKSPCIHAAVAVWACRLLPAGQHAGRLFTGPATGTVDDKRLAEFAALADELMDSGTAHLTDSWEKRANRAIRQTAGEPYPWLTQVLEELITLRALLTRGSAQYDPQSAADLTAELLLRHDVLRHTDDSIIQRQVGGGARRTAMQFGRTNLLGIGCDVRLRGHTTSYIAYLLNPDSGNLHCFLTNRVGGDFPTNGRRHVALNVPLNRFAIGHLLLGTCKVMPDGRIDVARGRGTAYAQEFAWERFEMPLRFTDFGMLADYIGSSLPGAIGSRHFTQGVTILQPAKVIFNAFNYRHQRVEATLEDAQGRTIRLRHPYTHRGRLGVDALLALLSEHADRVRFVSGRLGRDAAGLYIQPAGLVYDTADGRRLLQPWLAASLELEASPEELTEEDAAPHELEDPDAAETPGQTEDLRRRSTGERYLDSLHQTLGDLITTGLVLADGALIDRLGELANDLPTVGYADVGRIVSRLYQQLDARRHRLQWSAEPARASFAALLQFIALYPDVEPPA